MASNPDRLKPLLTNSDFPFQVFQKLLKDESFVDVTLVCPGEISGERDKKRNYDAVKAHKVGNRGRAFFLLGSRPLSDLSFSVLTSLPPSHLIVASQNSF